MFKIKKGISLFLITTLILSNMSGCFFQKKKTVNEAIQHDVCDILAFVENRYPMEKGIVTPLSDSYDFSSEMMESVRDFVSLKEMGTSAREYIIVSAKDTNEGVKVVEEGLEAYRKNRQSDFAGYAPAETRIIEDSEVIVFDNYVALFIDEDSKGIGAYFYDALVRDFELNDEQKQRAQEFSKELEMIARTENESESESESETETEKTTNSDKKDEPSIKPRTKKAPDGVTLVEEVFGYIEVYDSSHIVKAYKADDMSLLSNERDIAVYKKLKEIISRIIKPNMTQYEKEVAVHDYIVENTEYDSKCLEYSKWYTKYADQPYGCLVEGQAICVGYATTFKLFMDALDIECIVVTGSANDDPRENHGWNLVHLDDGKWYAVDVTWDDPIGWEGDTCHDYFNVDSNWLSDTSHYWEKENYPQATGGKYSGLEY